MPHSRHIVVLSQQVCNGFGIYLVSDGKNFPVFSLHVLLYTFQVKTKTCQTIQDAIKVDMVKRSDSFEDVSDDDGDEDILDDEDDDDEDIQGV